MFRNTRLALAGSIRPVRFRTTSADSSASTTCLLFGSRPPTLTMILAAGLSWPTRDQSDANGPDSSMRRGPWAAAHPASGGAIKLMAATSEATRCPIAGPTGTRMSFSAPFRRVNQSSQRLRHNLPERLLAPAAAHAKDQVVASPGVVGIPRRHHPDYDPFFVNPQRKHHAFATRKTLTVRQRETARTALAIF